MGAPGGMRRETGSSWAGISSLSSSPAASTAISSSSPGAEPRRSPFELRRQEISPPFNAVSAATDNGTLCAQSVSRQEPKLELCDNQWERDSSEFCGGTRNSAGKLGESGQPG